MKPRFVRRTTMHCPHDGDAVQIDLLMGKTGNPVLVLRCSARPGCPPNCDQACRRSAESVIGPARALFILPPGRGAPEELD
jgi:hypothetical protein